MDSLQTLGIAFALASDAMIVAFSYGVLIRSGRAAAALKLAISTGFFQALMPVIGFVAASGVLRSCEAWDHWIAFVLLALIGGNMIKESLGKAEEVDCSFCPKAMLPMAVATSIDALAVGVTFAFLNVSIVPAVSFIGVITFSLSAVGVYIGHLFGAKFKSKAELAGGIVLILMGLRILLEHLGVLDWFFGLFA